MALRMNIEPFMLPLAPADQKLDRRLLYGASQAFRPRFKETVMLQLRFGDLAVFLALGLARATQRSGREKLGKCLLGSRECEIMVVHLR